MAEIEEELKSLLMRVKEENEKASLFSPITACQTDGENLETVTEFILGGSKITVDGDCSHEIKKLFLLGRKAMTNLDSILERSGTTLPTKVYLVKGMFFLALMYGCESWTVKQAERQRIGAFLKNINVFILIGG